MTRTKPEEPISYKGLSAASVGALARLALMEEVDATPKPGLVDRANSGAHRDMDYGSFAASASVLEPHFARFAQLGQDMVAADESETFGALRPLGLAAEADMLAATGGANTHKGAIFSIGLLCAAAGRLGALGQSLSPICLSRSVARMTVGLCARELKAIGRKSRHTAGERMFLKYGALGARGEAESGFENARRYGLARLTELLRRGEDRNIAYVRALLSLMANVTDTNVLNRHDMDTALLLKSRAGVLHRRYSPGGTEQLDRELIAENISPGGCADLLAVAIFMLLLRQGQGGEALLPDAGARCASGHGACKALRCNP